MDEQLRTFFKEKLIETVGSSSAYEVEFDPTATSPVPQLVNDFLNIAAINFVEMSKTIAKHLHNAQGGVNPGGLVTVVDCTIMSARAIGILKLEKEEGVRLHQAMHEGKRTFDVSYIRDLILTRKTKLFKVGFFSPDSDGEVEGTVCDEQRGYMPRTEVAGFFLTTFLGCRLLADPRVSTKGFFLAAQDYFNQHLSDPVQHTQAMNHLLSELTNQRYQINVRAFARDYLPTAHRQTFLEHLRDAGVPDQTIRKDIELIKPQTEKMALEFESGVTVVGSREQFGESIRVSRLPAGAARVEVTGTIKSVKGK